MLEELKEEEIVNKVGGRFKLSTLIQKRLVQINRGSRPLVDFVSENKMEIVLQEILQKHPTSDKIADVAYELGDLYESKAYKQYDRAAAYFERAYQWRKGTRTDARLRAARLYDKQLNERTKAIELYRDVLAHDTEPERIKESEKRLAELTGNRK